MLVFSQKIKYTPRVNTLTVIQNDRRSSKSGNIKKKIARKSNIKYCIVGEKYALVHDMRNYCSASLQTNIISIQKEISTSLFFKTVGSAKREFTLLNCQHFFFPFYSFFFFFLSEFSILSLEYIPRITSIYLSVCFVCHRTSNICIYIFFFSKILFLRI